MTIMHAMISGDLVVGMATGAAAGAGGVPVPLHLRETPPDRLRYVDGALVDVVDCRMWWVDTSGRLRAEQRDPTWQPIEAQWNDRLVRDAATGLWRVESEADRLASVRAAATAMVDRQAEAARLQFVTAGDGQAAVYLRKAAEAREIAAADPADLADEPATRARWPLVAAAVGVTTPGTGDWAADLAAAAAEVSAQETMWLQAAAAIETVRLSAKAAIRTAADQTAVDAILAGLTWPA